MGFDNRVKTAKMLVASDNTALLDSDTEMPVDSVDATSGFCGEAGNHSH